MFRSAYVRMTAYYVAILMSMSLIFSVWVYQVATQELRVGLTARVLLETRRSPIAIARADIDEFVQEQFQAGRARILANLFYFNIAALGIGGTGSYFLARRTMQPIQDAMEAQNRFTADASHELRSPLAAMKTEIEVALRTKKLSSAEVRPLLASNLEEIDRLTRLAEGLLTLAHENNPSDLKPVQFDKAVQAAGERLAPLAKAKDIRLDFVLTPATVKADIDSLEKIIGILVDNAIKYSPNGSAIALELTRKGNQATLAIADQGVGIKSEDLPHIFDRFYRADTSRTKNKINGHGLGLSIAKKLVGQLGGHITATSQPGQGSTFRLNLPVYRRTDHS